MGRGNRRGHNRVVRMAAPSRRPSRSRIDDYGCEPIELDVSVTGFSVLSADPIESLKLQSREDEIFATKNDLAFTTRATELKATQKERTSKEPPKNKSPNEPEFVRPKTMDPSVLDPGEPLVDFTEKRNERRKVATNKILVYKKNAPRPAGGVLIDLSSNGFLVSAENLNIEMNEKLIIEVLGSDSLPAGTYQCSVTYIRNFGQFSSSNSKHFGLQVISASQKAKNNLMNYAA